MTTDHIRFLWIFLCFLLSFWNGLPLAAALTLCADYFLLFTPHYAAGMVFFLLVQYTYIQALRNRPLSLWGILLSPFLMNLPLWLLGLLYGLLFLRHFSLAYKGISPKQKEPPIPSGALSITLLPQAADSCRRLYFLALILFALCDITVAWGYLYRPLPNLIWLFYAPGQLLLALTAKGSPPRP